MSAREIPMKSKTKLLRKKVTGRHQPFFMNEILSNPCEKNFERSSLLSSAMRQQCGDRYSITSLEIIVVNIAPKIVSISAYVLLGKLFRLDSQLLNRKIKTILKAKVVFTLSRERPSRKIPTYITKDESYSKKESLN